MIKKKSLLNLKIYIAGHNLNLIKAQTVSVSQRLMTHQSSTCVASELHRNPDACMEPSFLRHEDGRLPGDALAGDAARVHRAAARDRRRLRGPSPVAARIGGLRALRGGPPPEACVVL